MSTPMYDLPEHFLMGVDAKGVGPVDLAEQAYHWVCWCGKPLCNKWIVPGDIYRKKTGNRHRIKIVHTKRPGECFYQILPPHNDIRDYGDMFEGTLSRDYEREYDD